MADVCPHGHELTPENTIIEPRATGDLRRCRECQNERIRKSAAKKKRAAEVAAAEAVAREAGEAGPTEVALVDRGRSRVGVGEVAKARPLKSGEIVAMTEDVIYRAWAALDDDKLKNSTAAQIATVLGIAIDKRQILKGEATVIFGTERRKQVEEMLPALLEEARRRGIQVDLKPDEFSRVEEPA